MGLVVLLAIGLALLWGWLVAYTAWMLTHPPRRTYGSAVARGRPGDPSELPTPRPFSSWTFRSRGMDLPVWEIAGDRPDGPAVILTHGWADSRIGALARVAAIAPAASRIIAWDLPGHGEAPGICRLGGAEAEDLLALIERVDGPAGVALYGWSLGAGASIAAAGRAAVLGVIAEAPYRLPATPARNVLRARGMPWRTTLRPALWAVRLAGAPGLRDAAFDRAALAAKVSCPLLVLHGEMDAVCPLDDGRAIAGAAPYGRLVVIPGGGHNDLWTDDRFAPRSAEAVRAFLAERPRPTLRA